MKNSENDPPIVKVMALIHREELKRFREAVSNKIGTRRLVC